MKPIILIICLGIALKASCQSLDTLCVKTADVKKCILISKERELCLEREATLNNVVTTQEEQIYTLQQKIEIQAQLHQNEIEILNNNIQIQKNKKRKNLLIGGGIGATIGFVLATILLQ